MTPSFRPDIDDLEAYGAPQIEARVRLNTNECPYPLPEAFASDLAAAVKVAPLHRYPDREFASLRKGLAELSGHPVDGVWAANGSNEVIHHLCLAFGGPGRRALVFDPTYALHTLIPRVVGMEVRADRLARGFSLPPDPSDAIRAADPSIVFVCSPNNPTGNAQSSSFVEKLCAAAQDALVVVDEAYGEFGGPTSVPLLDRFPNLVVVRTFSKAFSLAGVRLGYCLGDPAVVGELARVRLPYHLSTLTQLAGEVALRHLADAEALLDRIRLQRDRVVRELGEMDGVESFPSDANFVMFRTPADAASLWLALLKRGVLVRDVSGGTGLERCLRVTAGTEAETGAFLEALPDALKETM